MSKSKTSKTMRGQYCSPLSASKHSGGESCYTKPQLLRIIAAYNKKYPTPITTQGNKAQLWYAIDNRMNQCNNEWCWMETLGLDAHEAFRPARPAGRDLWLTTSDIRQVLSQYEELYDDFTFLGPVPIDFCELANNEVCNINLSRSRANGKTKIGIVFNTDPSNQPGKHWISMFIDISSSDPSKHTLEYFDSVGLAPLLPEIKRLVTNLQGQNPRIQIKLNCQGDMCTDAVRHQLSNTECGVYSINFIVKRLTGQIWSDLVTGYRQTDEQMTKLRTIYFRPTK